MARHTHTGTHSQITKLILFFHGRSNLTILKSLIIGIDQTLGPILTDGFRNLAFLMKYSCQMYYTFALIDPDCNGLKNSHGYFLSIAKSGGVCCSIYAL